MAEMVEKATEIAFAGCAAAPSKAAKAKPQMAREQSCSSCRHLLDDGFLGICANSITHFKQGCLSYEANSL